MHSYTALHSAVEDMTFEKLKYEFSNCLLQENNSTFRNPEQVSYMYTFAMFFKNILSRYTNSIINLKSLSNITWITYICNVSILIL